MKPGRARVGDHVLDERQGRSGSAHALGRLGVVGADPAGAPDGEDELRLAADAVDAADIAASPPNSCFSIRTASFIRGSPSKAVFAADPRVRSRRLTQAFARSEFAGAVSSRPAASTSPRTCKALSTPADDTEMKPM